MICKQCSGQLKVDKENKLLICPFCGATEPFDSISKEELQAMLDDVVNDVREENLEMYNKIVDTNKKMIASASLSNQKPSVLKISLMVLFLVMTFVFTAASFGTGYYVAGIVSLVQLLLVLTALVFIMVGHSKENTRLLAASRVLYGISAVLMVVWFIAIGSTRKTAEEHKEVFWPVSGFGSDLPQPNAVLKYVSSSNYYFSCDTEKISALDFADYISKCKEKGYNIDTEADDSKYIAYDKDDNELSIRRYANEEMIIQLKKAKEYADFYWPKSGGAELVPEPKADKICVDSLSDRNVRLYISPVDTNYMLSYIEELNSAGIKGYYNSDDKSYSGSDDKIYISIDFMRKDIMYFNITKKN